MRLTCDPKHNIAYLELRDRVEQVETVRIADELNIDIAPDGTVLRHRTPRRQKPTRGSDNGRLVVVDPTGREQALPLAS